MQEHLLGLSCSEKHRMQPASATPTVLIILSPNWGPLLGRGTSRAVEWECFGICPTDPWSGIVAVWLKEGWFSAWELYGYCGQFLFKCPGHSSHISPACTLWCRCFSSHTTVQTSAGKKTSPPRWTCPQNRTFRVNNSSASHQNTYWQPDTGCSCVRDLFPASMEKLLELLAGNFLVQRRHHAYQRVPDQPSADFRHDLRWSFLLSSFSSLIAFPQPFAPNSFPMHPVTDEPSHPGQLHLFASPEKLCEDVFLISQVLLTCYIRKNILPHLLGLPLSLKTHKCTNLSLG